MKPPENTLFTAARKLVHSKLDYVVCQREVNFSCRQGNEFFRLVILAHCKSRRITFQRDMFYSSLL